MVSFIIFRSESYTAIVFDNQNQLHRLYLIYCKVELLIVV